MLPLKLGLYDEYYVIDYKDSQTGIELSDGDIIEIMVKNDGTQGGGEQGGEDPQTPSTHTVHFNYTGDGRIALSMLRNVTTSTSLDYNADEITVNHGDLIRLGFSNTLYNITVNGNSVSGNQEFTINDDTTINIAATPKTRTVRLDFQNLSAVQALTKIEFVRDADHYVSDPYTKPTAAGVFTFQGDMDKKIRLTFNTTNYDVTIDDVLRTTATYEESMQYGVSLKISAVERVETVTLNLAFTNQGRAAMVSLHDDTADDNIGISGSGIQIPKGHAYTMTFNTDKFIVTVDGETLATSTKSFVANSDLTYNISAIEPTVERDPYVILNSTTTNAMSALTGVTNLTIGEPITLSGSTFQVEEGTQIRLTFDITNFVVVVNNQTLAEATKDFTITEDTYINIAATEKEEGVDMMTVNFNFINNGNAALISLFNSSKNRTITKANTIHIGQDQDLTLNFNTADYNITLTVDGVTETVNRPSYTITIQSNTTITISATRRAITPPASGVLVHWSTPGAIDLYVGSMAATNKVNLSATATQYLVPANSGAIYVCKADGFEFNSVTIGDKTLKPMYNGNYNISSYDYDGVIAEVDVEQVVYDCSFSLYVVNGRERVMVTMTGTGRNIELHTGSNVIAYSSKFEPGVEIQIPATLIVEYPDPNDHTIQNTYPDDSIIELWRNNEDLTDDYLEYNQYKGTWFGIDPDTDEYYFTLSNGDSFIVKWSDTDDEPEPEVIPAVLNLEFADANARNAMIMVFDTTKKKSLTISNTMTVNQGNGMRFVFNTFDWDVYINGNKLTPSAEASTNYEFTADVVNNYTIRVEERQYGTTTIGMYISDINGVVLHNGTFDGPAIDTTGMTGDAPKVYTYQPYKDAPNKSATVTYYTFEVSQKYPRIFVEEAEGYWLDAAQYTDSDNNTVDGTLATTEYALNVVDKKITPDTPVVIYLDTNGITTSPESVMLRDFRRNEYELQNGYNEFVMDIEYVTSLTAMALDVPMGTNMAVYHGMSSIAMDEDNGSVFEMTLDQGSNTIHIFCGTYPIELNLNAYIEEGLEAEVKVDRNRTFTATTPNIPVFQGAEIEITHADGSMMFLDNEQKTCDGNHSHLFVATDDHKVSIENAAVTLADATGHNATVNKEVASVAYERELTPAATATWQAICLPFDVAYSTWSNAGYRVLALDKDQTLDGKIVFVEIGNKAMQHNTPYLVQTPAGANALTLAAENTTLYAKASTEALTVDDGGLVSFVGTLTPVSLSNSDTQMVYGLKGGEFLHAGEGAKTMKAFRAYLSLPVASTQQTRMKIQAKGGEQTGIEDLTIENAEEGVFYNLKGQRVDNPESGLYIFNGQKVIIR